MRRSSRSILVLFSVLIISAACVHSGAAKETELKLWPEVEPFKTGTLKVSPIHTMHYECVGNPAGIPVVFLHGGPGGSCSPYMRRFCNPETFLMVLYDQRGCGKSTPAAELRENTTPHLVADIEKLRKHMNLDKIILFGGSWGTTLALAYAQTYPENVRAMVLRGVFTAAADEIDFFYHNGARLFFPEVHDRLLSKLPDPQKRPLPAYLFKLIRESEGEEKKKYINAWAAYEIKMASLHMPDRDVNDMIAHYDMTAFGLFENYYMSNECFLKGKEILKNTAGIAHIPTYIVNGRYDAICAPRNAYRLHKLLKNSTLVIAEGAGHWMGEKPIERTLLRFMKTIEKRSAKH